MVVGIDGDRRRIALALAPEDAVPGDRMDSGVEAGALLTGTVERVESFGVIVRLGPGQTGLVPGAELGVPRGTDLRRAFPVGTEMQVLVLAVEEGGRRVRLSREKAIAQAERAEAQAYRRQSTTGSGFGLTIGERLRQSRRD